MQFFDIRVLVLREGDPGGKEHDGRQRTSPSNEQGHQKASFWSSVCCDASQLFPDTIGVPLLIDRFRSQT